MKTTQSSRFSSEEFTLSMWLKWPRDITSGWKTLAEFHRSFDSYHWGLFTHAIGNAFHFRDGIDYVAFTPNINEWYNVTVTVDINGDIILYLNGEILANGTADPRTLAEGLFTLGANNEGSEIANAIIDEVRFYNLKMNQSEIQNLINPTTIWTLSTMVNGEGTLELNPPRVSYNDGETVQLTAIPADGWKFTAWSGGVIGNENPIEITMYQNKNIIANFESTFSVEENETDNTKLLASPNPFSNQTTITYNLSEYSKVRLSVYNLQGQEIHVLACGKQHAGNYSYQWNAINNSGIQSPNGIFYCKLRLDNSLKSVIKIIKL
jgi:hypothetical protein